MLRPVGRLDKDSEGLLLMTDDGAFINMLTHPSGGVGKLYRVTVNPRATEQQIIEMSSGVVLDDGVKTRPCVIHVVVDEPGRSVLEITLHEGRNRQIRRMCSAVGLQVVRLRRSAEGPVKLGMLQPGEYRELKKSAKGRAVLPARPAVPAPLKSAQILTKIAENSEKCAKFHLWKRRERSIIQLNGGFFVKYFYKKQSALP